MAELANGQGHLALLGPGSHTSPCLAVVVEPVDDVPEVSAFILIRCPLEVNLALPRRAWGRTAYATR